MTVCLKRTVFPHPANCVTAMRHPPLCGGSRSFLRLLHHAHGFIRLHLATSHILFCHHLLRQPLGRWPSVLKTPIALRQAQQSPGLRVSPDACLPNVPRLSADGSNGLWQARRPPPAWQRINFPVARELTQIQGFSTLDSSQDAPLLWSDVFYHG
jgi:hypothetical protein